MMLNPQNVGPDHPGLAQNGEIWPRQMRQGGHLIPSATSGGELDLHDDLILEFPFGEVRRLREAFVWKGVKYI